MRKPTSCLISPSDVFFFFFSISFLMIFTASCPVDWITRPTETKCFGYFGKAWSSNDSEATCNIYGGHLAALLSWKELNVTHSLCNGTSDGCWVGGKLVILLKVLDGCGLTILPIGMEPSFRGILYIQIAIEQAVRLIVPLVHHAHW